MTSSKTDPVGTGEALGNGSPPQPSRPKGVWAKLAYVQTHIASVQKTGQAPAGAGGFKYVQEHKILELLRPLLREVGAAVVVEPARCSINVEPSKIGSKDGVLVTLTGLIRFIDAETGDEISAVVAGQGEDISDKAAGKAQTYLTKYGLQKFFLIPTEGIDDSDADAPPAEEPTFAPPPALMDEDAERLKKTAKDLYRGLQDEISLARFNEWLASASVSHDRLEDFVDYLAKRVNEKHGAQT